MVARADRKVRPLRLLKDCGTKTVLTMDRNLPEESDCIRYMNLVDWLRGQADGWLPEPHAFRGTDAGNGRSEDVRKRGTAIRGRHVY